MFKHLPLVSLFTITCSMIITDLKDKPLALFDIGYMKIKTGTLKVIYTIETKKIFNALRDIENKMELYQNNQQVEEEVSKIKNLVNRITPYAIRRHRRWDLIGTVYKWIAGVPDADDLRYIQGSINELQNNNDLQININKDISSKVNEIVKIINNVSPMNNAGSSIDLLHLINQIHQLRNQIEAIQDAIILAKRQIVSHRLLTTDEVFIIADTIRKAGIRLEMPEQALNFVSPTVIISGNNLNYILTVPKVKKTTYRVSRVETIAINDEMIDLPEKTYASHFPEVFIIHGNCKELADFYLCNRNDIQQMEHKGCVWKVIFNLPATCGYKKIATKHGNLLEISPSLILLNNHKVKVQDSFITRNLTGSFIIEYHNETININGKEFTNSILHTSNHQIIFKPMWQPKIQRNNIQPLNITNLNKTQPDHLQLEREPFWPYSTLSFIIFLAIVVIVLIRR